MSETGMFFWNELMTPDVEAAKAFYGRVFGWTARTERIPGGEGDYTGFMQGEAPVGGALAPPEPGIPAHWMPYVRVEDADAAQAAALPFREHAHHADDAGRALALAMVPAVGDGFAALFEDDDEVRAQARQSEHAVLDLLGSVRRVSPAAGEGCVLDAGDGRGVLPTRGACGQAVGEGYVGGRRIVAAEVEVCADVRPAIDLIQATYEKRYDLAIIVSNDSDFRPAVKLARVIAESQARELVFQSVFPVAPNTPKKKRRGVPGTQWVHID